ncbi:MAG: hypothetical protein IPM29_17305 [Planctomycetes bacterium]|nr:hypothetical protein [Planctomycetota bacterium]
MVDKIHEVSGERIQWITGTGDVNYFVPQTVGVPTDDPYYTWFSVEDNYALSRLRLYDPPGGPKGLERYRPDGSVMRYEYVESDDFWRPDVFFDAYDNAWSYTWASATAASRLHSIVGPRGIAAMFTWTSAGSGLLCSVTYSNSTTAFTALSWSFNVDASGKLLHLTLPVTEYVTQPQNDPLYDLSTPHSDARTLTFSYYTIGVGEGLLDTIEDSRLSGSGQGGGYILRKHIYRNDLSTAKPQVIEQIDELGIVHRFTYTVG